MWGTDHCARYHVRRSLNQVDTILEKKTAAAVIPTPASRWRGGGGEEQGGTGQSRVSISRRVFLVSVKIGRVQQDRKAG